MSVVVNNKYCFSDETHLTVHNNSLFFKGDGFIVYDPNGDVLFRFDSYGTDSQAMDELNLMDNSGNDVLTIVRKRYSFHQRWEGYVGERKEDDHPIFSVYSSSIIGPSTVMVHVNGRGGAEYRIEGSFPVRCCKIYNTSKATQSEDPIAEIKRKGDPVMLGRDVFLLCLKPGFDSAFAMGIVLVLDQMYGRDDVVEDTEHVYVHVDVVEDTPQEQEKHVEDDVGNVKKDDVDVEKDVDVKKDEINPKDPSILSTLCS